MVKSCLILLFLFFTFSYGKPVKESSKPSVKAPKVTSTADAFKYLDKFGYNPCDDHGNGKTGGKGPLCESSFRTMIEHFQTVFHLPVTGKLDSPTITLMNKPRCSLGDYPLSYSAFRSW
jgi:hypothetical protein